MSLYRNFLAVFTLACICSICILPISAFAMTGELDISDVEWRLSLNNSIIQSSDLPFGADFIVDVDTAVIPGPELLLDALNGTQFILEQTPPNAEVTININLNVQGDGFMPIPKASCCFNATVETLVNGTPVDSGTMMVTMVIPSTGLDYLLSLCGASVSQRDVVFASYTNGSVDAEQIETNSQVLGMTARFFPGGMIVGGKYTDFGIPASVGYSTWYKVKMLFE